MLDRKQQIEKRLGNVLISSSFALLVFLWALRQRKPAKNAFHAKPQRELEGAKKFQTLPVRRRWNTTGRRSQLEVW
jgi:hypothetical protein